ncbi:DUF4214 domain-containing protein [Metarhizobium album]|nr:DUF4214 domain-containing protein [Rhizobium album]
MDSVQQSSFDLINEMFEKVLLRTPAEAESGYFLDSILQGAFDIFGALSIISSSGEARAKQDFDMPVVAMYQGLLGRLPSADEFKFFKTAMEQGSIAKANLLPIFTGSPEFAQVNPSLGNSPTNTDIINLFYKNFLNRSANVDDVRHWSSSIDRGLSVQDVAYSILTSGEFHETFGAAIRSYVADVADGVINDPANTGSLVKPSVSHKTIEGEAGANTHTLEAGKPIIIHYTDPSQSNASGGIDKFLVMDGAPGSVQIKLEGTAFAGAAANKTLHDDGSFVFGGNLFNTSSAPGSLPADHGFFVAYGGEQTFNVFAQHPIGKAAENQQLLSVFHYNESSQVLTLYIDVDGDKSLHSNDMQIEFSGISRTQLMSTVLDLGIEFV